MSIDVAFKILEDCSYPWKNNWKGVPQVWNAKNENVSQEVSVTSLFREVAMNMSLLSCRTLIMV